MPISSDDPMILVGRVAGGFGVRGEVRISTYTEEPMALKGFKRLLRQDGSTALSISQARAVKDGLICRCPEITTKEAADALRGLKLFVPRSALPEPDEDEFYLTDLIGMAVRHVATGEDLGKIKSVQDFGAGDLLEIIPPLGGQTWYLPFTRAAAPEVKLAERLVLADPPNLVGDPEGPQSDEED
ncbi:16S rRNA processing protein RimM [Caulobacter flavus]|uniref:Ribosome maturation factor RimM n=1 Tax=Caulobacter flavus TaxID=1679497 RepID=A0A2N5CTZ4_9CAUL|nr:ribosome maturation factor RimM [Caulobacter flavus]AYV45756.1 16S rRNA processing protein RimM [Caulobacter flavus]PLR15800.1 16S rRNA processing protein RimM [Caulobacter flavus]